MILDNDECKKIKEIADIKKEYDKTVKLYYEQKWEELNKHLSELKQKYCVETAIYNSLPNSTPPANLQQNAINCMNFLNHLAFEKLTELGYNFMQE